MSATFTVEKTGPNADGDELFSVTWNRGGDIRAASITHKAARALLERENLRVERLIIQAKEAEMDEEDPSQFVVKANAAAEKVAEIRSVMGMMTLGG